MAERRALLEQFFFTGIDGFAPVIDPGNFTLASRGGIRTLQNTAGSRDPLDGELAFTYTIPFTRALNSRTVKPARVSRSHRRCRTSSFHIGWRCSAAF